AGGRCGGGRRTGRASAARPRRGRSRSSVRSGPYRLGDRRASTLEAGRRRFGRAELLIRENANRRLRLLLDLRLALFAAAPTGVDERALPFHQVLEIVVADLVADAVLLASLP